MIQATLKFLKCHKFYSVRLMSNSTDKSFFIDLAKHTIDVKKQKEPKNYLKSFEESKLAILGEDGEKNVNFSKSKKRQSSNKIISEEFYDQYENYEEFNEDLKPLKSNKNSRFPNQLDTNIVMESKIEEKKSRKRSFNRGQKRIDATENQCNSWDFSENSQDYDKVYKNHDYSSRKSESKIDKSSHVKDNEINPLEYEESQLSNINEESQDLDQFNNEVLPLESLQKQIDELDLDEIKTLPENILNIGPLIERNETLTNLLQYGVNLNCIENTKGGSNILVRLDWKKDVLPMISFFKEQANFTDKQISVIFSNFSQVFRIPMEDMKGFMDYLKSREITDNDLITIINKRSLLLTYKSDFVENKLTELETLTGLTTKEMNDIIIAEPKVITINMNLLKYRVAEMTKVFGFTDKEMKFMLKSAPSLLIAKKEKVNQNFIFLKRALNMPYEDIVKCAAALVVTPNALSERVKYLIYLNRYQTDPTKELYTPITNIIGCNEKDFCEKVAHTSVIMFRKFVKTL